jgi:hypothetical protein
MAIQRTRPGQSFLNRPIGVVSQRTGAEKVYEARARQAEQIGQFAFEYAVSTQKKEGVEYTRNVEVRDENGQASFQQMPASLGKYGKAEAEKIFAERFLTAAKIDASEVFNKLHRAYKNDAAGFERASTEYMKQTALKMEADGAGDLARIWHDNAYATAMQHTNNIVLEQIKLQEAEATANFILGNKNDIGDMNAALAAGNDDQANLIYSDMIAAAQNAVKTGVLTPRGFTAMISDIGDNYLITKAKNKTKNFDSDALKVFMSYVARGQFNKVNELVPGLGDDFKRLAKTQTRLDKFEASFSGVITDVKDAETVLTESITALGKATSGFGDTNQKASEKIYTNPEGLNIRNLNDFAGMTEDQIKFAKDSNLALPSFAVKYIKNIADGNRVNEDPELVAGIARTLNSLRMQRGQLRDMGLEVNQIVFLENHRKLMDAFGADAASALTQAIALMEIDDTETTFYAAKLGKKTTEVDTRGKLLDVIRDHLKDELGNALAADEYAIAYASLLNTGSAEDADKVIKGVYDSQYQYYRGYEGVEKPMTIFGRKAQKRKFTPEYYYTGDELRQFENVVTAAAKNHFSDPTVDLAYSLDMRLGRDFFLRPHPFNNVNRGQWMLVDSKGNIAVNDNQKPILIDTNGQAAVTRMAERKAIGLAKAEKTAERQARRRQIRSALIELAADQIRKEGISLGEIQYE